jgi:hypothetical protein
MPPPIFEKHNNQRSVQWSTEHTDIVHREEPELKHAETREQETIQPIVST